MRRSGMRPCRRLARCIPPRIVLPPPRAHRDSSRCRRATRIGGAPGVRGPPISGDHPHRGAPLRRLLGPYLPPHTPSSVTPTPSVVYWMLRDPSPACVESKRGRPHAPANRFGLQRHNQTPRISTIIPQGGTQQVLQLLLPRSRISMTIPQGSTHQAAHRRARLPGPARQSSGQHVLHSHSQIENPPRPEPRPALENPEIAAKIPTCDAEKSPKMTCTGYACMYSTYNKAL